MNVHLKSVSVILATAAPVLCLYGGQAMDLIRNGDFEQDTNGDGLADSWQFAGDQGVVVNWSRDAGYTGSFSQRLQCTRFTGTSSASHVMLCQVNTLRLEKGQWYKISFAAREQDIPGGGVQVAISDTQVWQNCGLDEAFQARTAWRQFEFVFQATRTISDHVHAGVPRRRGAALGGRPQPAHLSGLDRSGSL
jgi:hypothetical protein